MSFSVATLSLYEFELGKAAHVLINEMCQVKKGETVILTADTESDPRVVNAVAQAVFTVGAKPLVMWMATPPGPGAMVDDFLPSESILAAVLQTDCWIEFNRQYINYSNLMETAVKLNKKLRYMILPAMVVDVFVRLFARVEQAPVADFVEKLANMTKAAKRVRITSAVGQDVEFNNHPDRPVLAETGRCHVPCIRNLNGQIAWTPDLDSVNGVIVFDGSLVPQIGILEQPVKVYLENGVIQKTEGGRQAKQFEEYLNSFDHPQMMRPAHVCYGFHPGAKITGQVGEDERVWGCTQWGFGAIGSFLLPPDGIPAPSHIDGITMSSSVWLDGVQIMDRGTVIDPELKALAAKCGK